MQNPKEKKKSKDQQKLYDDEHEPQPYNIYS